MAANAQATTAKLKCVTKNLKNIKIVGRKFPKNPCLLPYCFPHCYLRIPGACCFPFLSTLGLGGILPFQKGFSVEKYDLPGWPVCASGLAAVVRSGIKKPQNMAEPFCLGSAGRVRVLYWGAGRRLLSPATTANSCFFFFAGFLLELRWLCHPGGSHSTHYTHIALMRLMVAV